MFHVKQGESMAQNSHYHQVTADISEALLTFSAVANAGPHDGQVVTNAAPGALPLTTIAVAGFYPKTFVEGAAPGGRDLFGGEQGMHASVVPFPILVTLYASIQERLTELPADEQTRFHAMVDQERHSYREQTAGMNFGEDTQ